LEAGCRRIQSSNEEGTSDALSEFISVQGTDTGSSSHCYANFDSSYVGPCLSKWSKWDVVDPSIIKTIVEKLLDPPEEV
jgi:hypothetical protein